MLVKDATARRARQEYLAFLGETLQQTRPAVGALRRGRRPTGTGPLRVRLRATRSLLRLTPAALRSRRAVSRSVVLTRLELERELVTSR